MDCPVCYEAITAATGRVDMPCSHTFHFRCIAEWFQSRAAEYQEMNCPCCRAVPAEIARLPRPAVDLAETLSEDGERPYYYEDEVEQLWLVRTEFDDILRNVLGGENGVTDAIWFHFFNPDDEEDRVNPAIRLCFARNEINDYALAQGGSAFTDEQWEAFLQLYRHQEGPVEPEEAEEPEQPDEPEAEEPVYQRELSAEQLEAYRSAWINTAIQLLEVRRANGGVLQWARQPDGSWHRLVLNPEEVDPAVWGEDHPEPPPDDLVALTDGAARKIQAVWRGFHQRQQLKSESVTAQMPTIVAQAVQFIQIRKIQAVWRGYKSRRAELA